MTSEQSEQGRWRVSFNEYLVSPNGRVMAQRTERVAVLHDLAAALNALEAERDALTQKLAAAESAIADMVANIRRIDSHDEGAIPWAWFIRWADALTPSEKGD